MGIEPTAPWESLLLRRPALTFSGVLNWPRESPLNPTGAAAHPTLLPSEFVLRHAHAVARLLSSLGTRRATVEMYG